MNSVHELNLTMLATRLLRIRSSGHFSKELWYYKRAKVSSVNCPPVQDIRIGVPAVNQRLWRNYRLQFIRKTSSHN